MLGPVDVEDWDRNDGDDLRAEIRQLPIVRLHARDPQAAARQLGRKLARSLALLSQGADLPLEALRQLKADLSEARDPVSK